MQKAINKIVYWLGAAMALFHIVDLIFLPLPANYFRPIHLLFVLCMIYLIYPIKKGGKVGIDNLILIILSLAATIYSVFNIALVAASNGIWTTHADIVCGVICILVVLEAARRTVGWALPSIAAIFLLYGAFGNYIPGVLGHRGYSLARIVTSIYAYDGIYGTALDTVATFVVMFIIFAAFLERTGCGDVFMELAKGIAGGLRGGPAKVAVIASALFGSISGSAVANVASTGSITIPMMKKSGFTPELAAAVEADASTGGQIMPPIMASGAFLMAEFLGVKYNDIMKAALIPAVMYFLMVWISIDCEAAKLHLSRLNKDELPSVRQILKKDWLVLMPLVLLVFLLVVVKYSAIRCAFFSLIASILVILPDKARRMRLKDIIDCLASSARSACTVAGPCACAGIVIGVVGMTGLGLKVSSLIIGVAGNNVVLALLLTMVTAIIFGMGLPTTVSYILCESVLAPVLTSMGILPLAAHMFIFYFACLSGITPPVALAAYTGAGIAQCNAMKASFLATKLNAIAFVLPYMFALRPALLAQGTAIQIALEVIFGIVCCLGMAGFLHGWAVIRCSLAKRMILGVGTVLLITPYTILNTAGAAIVAVIYGINKMKQRKAIASEVTPLSHPAAGQIEDSEQLPFAPKFTEDD